MQQTNTKVVDRDMNNHQIAEQLLKITEELCADCKDVEQEEITYSISEFKDIGYKITLDFKEFSVPQVNMIESELSSIGVPTERPDEHTIVVRTDEFIELRKWCSVSATIRATVEKVISKENQGD